MAAFTAAATSYATWGEPMIPFYLFYSMFGFQRVGDLLWALGDCRGRGFLLGCTAGRTTLNGEGLQHQDGHSLLLASTVPERRRLRPGLLLRGGHHRRGRHPADDRARAGGPRLVPHPLQRELPDAGPARRPGRGRAVRLGHHQGHVPVRPPGPIRGEHRPGPGRPGTGTGPRILLFSGSAWQAATEARRLLAADWGVDADLWSVTSYKSLREDAISVERWNRLHPGEPSRVPFVTEQLGRVGRARSWPSPTSCGPCPTRCRGGCPALHLARHRRLRPVGHPGRAAALLRGRRRPRGGRRPPRPGRRRGASRRAPWPTPSGATASTRRQPTPGRPEPVVARAARGGRAATDDRRIRP